MHFTNKLNFSDGNNQAETTSSVWPKSQLSLLLYYNYRHATWTSVDTFIFICLLSNFPSLPGLAVLPEQSNDRNIRLNARLSFSIGDVCDALSTSEDLAGKQRSTTSTYLDVWSASPIVNHTVREREREQIDAGRGETNQAWSKKHHKMTAIPRTIWFIYYHEDLTWFI